MTSTGPSPSYFHSNGTKGASSLSHSYQHGSEFLRIAVLIGVNWNSMVVFGLPFPAG